MSTLIALVLAVGGCSTTTDLYRLEAGRWLAENASAEMVVEPTDPAENGVAIEALSPTSVRFHARSGAVVPIERVRRITVIHRGLGAAEGMVLGAAVGALAGVLTGSLQSGPSCDECGGEQAAPALFAAMFGVVGLFTGFGLGFATGHREVLELR